MGSMTQILAVIQNIKIVQFPFKEKCKFLEVFG